MKRLIAAAAAAVACTYASASNTDISFDNISFSFASGLTNVHLVSTTVSAGLTASGNSTSSTASFAGWPVEYSLGISGGGATAGVTISNGSIDLFGSSGLTGSYAAGLEVVWDFAADPIPDDVPSPRYERAITMNMDMGIQVGVYLDNEYGWQTMINHIWLGDDNGSAAEPGGGPFRMLYGDGSGSFQSYDRSVTDQGLQFTTHSDGYVYNGYFFKDGHARISMSIETIGRAPIDPVSPIPEPSTYALMFAGLAAVGFTARRRRAA